MNATLIPVRDGATWQQALAELPHAFAHTWEYNYALSLTAANQNLFLWRGELGEARAVCPLLVREWNGARDVVTPYGFSGFATNAEAAAWPKLQELWRSFAQAQGWVCGYVGLHPLLAVFDHVADASHSGQQVFALDLTPDEATLAAGFSRNLRDRLRVWEKSGAWLTADAAVCQAFFCTEYADFAQRVQASSAYAFAPATLAALLAHPQVYVVGAGREETIEAVSVFGYSAAGGEYLFNVALADGREHSARLLWEGIRELKRRGVPWLNLGGGIQPGDGLAAFKARFGGKPEPLRALKQVYDEPLYQQLCARVGADARSRAGYFPAYRAAQPVPVEMKSARSSPERACFNSRWQRHREPDEFPDRP